MNDFETLDELREMWKYAKQAARDTQEQIDALSYRQHSQLVTLHKAEERYLAHLEMMAAGVKQ